MYFRHRRLRFSLHLIAMHVDFMKRNLQKKFFFHVLLLVTNSHTSEFMTTFIFHNEILINALTAFYGHSSYDFRRDHTLYAGEKERKEIRENSN